MTPGPADLSNLTATCLPTSQPTSIASSARTSFQSNRTSVISSSPYSPHISSTESPGTSPTNTPNRSSSSESLGKLFKANLFGRSLISIFSYHRPPRSHLPSTPASTYHQSTRSSLVSSRASSTLSLAGTAMLDAAISLPAPALPPPRTPIPKDLPRFVQDAKFDGGHEHHLRCCSRRHDRIYRKIKNLIGHKHEAPEDYDDISHPEDDVLRLQHQQQSPVISTIPATLALNRNATGDRTIVPALTHTGVNFDPSSAFVPEIASLKRARSANRINTVRPDLTRKLEENYGKCHEVVGRGAFGIVRVSHKKLEHGERLYAVKEFRRRTRETDTKYTKRLMAEYNIGVNLYHPNICRVLDLVKDDKGEMCEVMEFCAGGDLFTVVLAAGQLDMVEADCFFRQLVSGVSYLHDKGIAHRDLKPENLLLTKRGSLKITDFGNGECFREAWETESHMVSGVCGSAPYIAPEEYTEAEFDACAVDVWACGVIYMAMVTGRHLWNVAKPCDDFYSRYINCRKSDNGYAPVEILHRACCRSVVYSILEPLPATRLTAAQVLKTEWVRDIPLCKAGKEG